VSGLQYTMAFDKLWFLPADITLGSDFSYHALDERMPSYNRLIMEDVNVTSLFAQSDWKNKQVGFLLGARLDKHNLLQQPIFSPRVTARYNPIGDLSLRASYARGFRAPEIFDEDLHLSAAAGEIVIVQRADNLRTEHSHSLSTSADWYRSFGQVQFNLLVEGFYTRLSNVFILEDLGQNNEGYFVRERRNGDGAVVQGVNLEGTLVPGTRTRLQFGFTFQQGRYDEAIEWSSSDDTSPTRDILRSPNRYGYFSATRELFQNLDLALTGTYTGSMLTPHFAGYIPADELKATDYFLDVNLKISYRVKLSTANSILVSVGMNNVLDSYQKDFDKGFLRDGGYIYGPSLPRTYFVGIKLGNLF
jgi:outer membrane receptor for ferrienterochelin and colicins